MNEQNDTNTDNADRDLLDELKRGQRGSSRAHDNAVLAKAAAAAEDITQRSSTNKTDAAPPRRFAWMLAAAAIAAVMVVPMLIIENDDTLRGQDANVLPVHTAQLSSPPTNFRWTAVPGADRYTLVLRDAGADEVWRSAAVRNPELSPDPSAQGVLSAGGTFIWTIEATTPGATTELGPYQFTVEE